MVKCYVFVESKYVFIRDNERRLRKVKIKGSFYLSLPTLIDSTTYRIPNTNNVEQEKAEKS